MIKTAEAMVKEIKAQMRGGEGQVIITHLLQPEDLTGKARLVARLTLEQGCSIGLHQHVAEEEIFAIIKGEGLIDDNGVEKAIKAGDVALTRGGESHAIRNVRPETLEIMAVILLYA
jgi:mannose-6-phosphate isomerase-like protein (cupin superfamily)